MVLGRGEAEYSGNLSWTSPIADTLQATDLELDPAQSLILRGRTHGWAQSSRSGRSRPPYRPAPIIARPPAHRSPHRRQDIESTPADSGRLPQGGIIVALVIILVFVAGAIWLGVRSAQIRERRAREAEEHYRRQNEKDRQ